jgi:hypothetical protein
MQRIPPSGGSAITKVCDHKFVFQRQETIPESPGYRRVEDVFYCERCLLYRRVKVRLEQESRERFGWDVVERFC